MILALRILNRKCYIEEEAEQYVPSIEPEPEGEYDNPDWKKNPVRRCAYFAERKGFNSFAVWNGVCKSSDDVLNVYEEDAEEITCPENPVKGTKNFTGVYEFEAKGTNEYTLKHST